MTGVIIAALLIAVPAAVFVAWPLVRGRGRGRGAVLSLPPDEREELQETKRAALRALRELEFEHEAGHISAADYAELRVRYEAEAAAALDAIDRLQEQLAPAPAVQVASPARGRGWRHPAALGATAAALLVFGVVLGVGAVRYTEPDRMAGAGSPAGDIGALQPGPVGSAADAGVGAPPANMPVTPEVMQGMLNAARQALQAGQYAQAISAYQAILNRDPKNVEAMTHLGLIVAIGGHADSALETFDKALALRPDYPPALLYRGQVLYEAKNDVPGAVRAWERYVAVTDSKEEQDRVRKLIADAKARPAGGR